MKKSGNKNVLSTPGTKVGLFSPTDWGVLQTLKQSSRNDQRTILDVLAKKYWTPIVQYLLIRGYEQSEAQDLAQDFFAFAVESDLFSKADPQRGRFRSFLLGSLNNFLANQWRKKSSQKRQPTGGITSVEELTAFGYYQSKSLVNKETPEMIFHHAWLREVVRNVLQRLEMDFRRTGKSTHLALFHSRVVAPELDGKLPPPLEDQARELGLKYKEAANQILTAKRAFLRILHEEVKAYTSSEDAAREKRDVLALLSFEVRTSR